MSTKTWFFSDPHYGHKNICGPKISNWSSGYRDFSNVSDMNSAIVNSINDTVEQEDVLWCLGDWSFGPQENIKGFRDRIICKNVHLVYGNHDGHIRKNKHHQELFSSCQDYKELSTKSGLIVLSHYSMRVWNKSHRGSMHLYGHSHHSLPPWGKSMDVGWCKWRRPLDLSEITKKLFTQEIIKVDHH